MQFKFVAIAVAALVASASAQNVTNTTGPIPTPSAITSAGSTQAVSFFGLVAAIAGTMAYVRC